jgi:hypothetical protein
VAEPYDNPVTRSTTDAGRDGWWERAYDGLVDTGSATSLSTALRRRRWAMVAAAFPSIGTMKVLDLGGTVQSWTVSPIRPAQVTVVNLATAADAPAWIDQIHADACDLLDGIRRVGWDLVYSNSLIEHLGGHARRKDFARGVAELAPAHWIQTPYRYFPVEPHWLFPGFQFLPPSARTRVSMHWPLNRWRAREHRPALSDVLDVELLTRTELSFYFPGSTIRSERLLGLTKSIIAVSGSR